MAVNNSFHQKEYKNPAMTRSSAIYDDPRIDEDKGQTELSEVETGSPDWNNQPATPVIIVGETVEDKPFIIHSTLQSFTLSITESFRIVQQNRNRRKVIIVSDQDIRISRSTSLNNGTSFLLPKNQQLEVTTTDTLYAYANSTAATVSIMSEEEYAVE